MLNGTKLKNHKRQQNKKLRGLKILRTRKKAELPKLTKFHYKESITKEYIDFFEEYQQMESALVTLRDHFLDVVKALPIVLDESQDEQPIIKTYNVVTILKKRHKMMMTMMMLTM